MKRTPGWTVLAQRTLELLALAFSDFAMARNAAARPGRPDVIPDHVSEAQATTDAAMVDEQDPGSALAAATGRSVPVFLAEVADPQARYFHSSDPLDEIVVALYADGRVRAADGSGRCFTGTVSGTTCALQSLHSDERCELHMDDERSPSRMTFVGGPFDRRTCARSARV